MDRTENKILFRKNKKNSRQIFINFFDVNYNNNNVNYNNIIITINILINNNYSYK